MSTEELLTRQAAAAIGLDTASGDWHWQVRQGGLLKFKWSGDVDRGFSPLNEPSDAYEIEAILQPNVSYSTRIAGTSVMLSLPDGPSILKLIEPDVGPLKTRMRAAVEFAALYAIMEDKWHGESTAAAGN